MPFVCVVPRTWERRCVAHDRWCGMIRSKGELRAGRRRRSPWRFSKPARGGLAVVWRAAACAVAGLALVGATSCGQSREEQCVELIADGRYRGLSDAHAQRVCESTTLMP